MRFVTFRSGNETGLAIADDKSLRGHVATSPGFPGALAELIAKGSEALRHAHAALKTAPSCPARTPISFPEAASHIRAVVS